MSLILILTLINLLTLLIVGKVNDYTFGTGLRRAQYWVQVDT